MISKEQIAHDLALVYLNNRYGVEVTGDVDVSSDNGNVSGYGSVTTENLPNLYEKKMKIIKTDEKGLFGIKKRERQFDGYLINNTFKNMIDDYYIAYDRILDLLNDRN